MLFVTGLPIFSDIDSIEDASTTSRIYNLNRQSESTMHVNDLAVSTLQPPFATVEQAKTKRTLETTRDDPERAEGESDAAEAAERPSPRVAEEGLEGPWPVEANKLVPRPPVPAFARRPDSDRIRYTRLRP